MLRHERIDPDTSEQERLSALLDGEVDEAEVHGVLGRVHRDPALARRWAEYCLIGDALRGEVMLQPGLDRRLHEALAAEPTVLAPRQRPRHGLRYTRPFAWAAAVAAVVALTWTVWTALPERATPLRMAAQPEAVRIEASQVMPYLVAHQDFSQGLVAQPEMHFSRVTLVGLEAKR